MKRKVLFFLLPTLLSINIMAVEVSSLESLWNSAEALYSTEKTKYINYLSNVLSSNNMPSKYANEVIKDVTKDINNSNLSVSSINSSIDAHSKSVAEVVNNANLSQVPGLQGVDNLTLDYIQNNYSYTALTNKVSQQLNTQYCSGAEQTICNTKQIEESMSAFKSKLPESEYNIAKFDVQNKSATKLTIAGNCACNPVMYQAYQGMTNFIVGENLSQMPSKIDEIIKEVKLRTKNFEEENKNLDSLITDTKNFNYNLALLKFELIKENNLNYQK